MEEKKEYVEVQEYWDKAGVDMHWFAQAFPHALVLQKSDKWIRFLPNKPKE